MDGFHSALFRQGSRVLLWFYFDLRVPVFALAERAHRQTGALRDIVLHLLHLRLHVLQLEEDLVRLGLELPVDRPELLNLVVFLAQLLVQLLYAGVEFVLCVEDFVQLVVEDHVPALGSLFRLLEDLLFVIQLLLGRRRGFLERSILQPQLVQLELELLQLPR